MSFNEKTRDGLFREFFAEQLKIVAAEVQITTQPLDHLTVLGHLAEVGQTTAELHRKITEHRQRLSDLLSEDEARRRFKLGVPAWPPLSGLSQRGHDTPTAIMRTAFAESEITEQRTDGPVVTCNPIHVAPLRFLSISLAGCAFRCHDQAELIIVLKSEYLGQKPNTSLARAGSAMRTGGSPGRRWPMAAGIARPVTLEISSST